MIKDRHVKEMTACLLVVAMHAFKGWLLPHGHMLQFST